MQNYNQTSWGAAATPRSPNRRSTGPGSTTPVSSPPPESQQTFQTQGGFDQTTSPPRRMAGVQPTSNTGSPSSRAPGSPIRSHSRSNSSTNLYSTPGNPSYGRTGGGGGNDGRDVHGGSESTSVQGGSGGMDQRSADSDRNRLNQLMQNFFTKMALVVVRSRMNVPPVFIRGTTSKKINKWFNVELEETDIFREELRPWKNSDAVDPRPPPLIVETYLDAEELTANQTLVIMDENGKKHNVENMLSASRSWRRGSAANNAKKEVILERWRVDLAMPVAEYSPELAVVYKKSIVLFRSLYAYARLLPTWKFQKRFAKAKLSSSGLRVCCRIVNADVQPTTRPDPLEISLVDHEQDVTSHFEFGKVECPAGIFSINVVYRTNCDFKVDNYETLLSSHLLNLDEHYFTPPPHQRTASQPINAAVRGEPGSLPSAGPANASRGDPSQAYGSLSSFHPAAGVTSQSPISALRNLHIGGSSSNGSPNEPSSLPPRSIQGSKASLRSTEGQSFASLGVQRRPSVSFMQPFKSPSLSASPGADQMAPSPRTSVGRISQVIGVPVPGRQRPVSMGTMSPSSLKSAVYPQEAQTASSSQESVTKPSVTRYSSSFGQRRPRLSSGASRTEDDGASSGRGSFVSSHAPGSGMINDAIAMEDKSLTDFMDLLDNRQSLRSFQATEESGKRTAKALNKFSKMKDSNAVLSDSLSSSLFMSARSTSTPSSSSRQLSGVPPALSGVSVSTSSSPGKPISPHTPAIPSRLGLNETLIHDHSREHDPISTPEQIPSQLTERLHSGRRMGELPTTTSTTATTSPMNIPSSPRFAQVRRSNSLSQGHIDDDASSGYEPLRPYGPEPRHSTSLDSLERLPPVLLSEDASLPTRTRTAPGGPGSGASTSPTAPRSQSPVEAKIASRTTDRVLGSSFSNRRPFVSSRGNTESPIRPPMVRTPSDTRTPSAFPADDELLFDFSDRDMAQRRSLENDRSGSSFSRRGTKGLDGRGDRGRGDR